VGRRRSASRSAFHCCKYFGDNWAHRRLGKPDGSEIVDSTEIDCDARFKLFMLSEQCERSETNVGFKERVEMRGNGNLCKAFADEKFDACEIVLTANALS